MTPIALLSVSNKQGLVPLARTLIEDHGFEIISSGGTAKTLEIAGLKVKKVSDYTGAPEILNGRVKTLHPLIHGGILAKRNDSNHQKDLFEQNIKVIDLVVVNLYPFQETVAKPDATWEEAIENIDIGGPTLIRAAAKNHDHVSILSDPSQYEMFLEELKSGSITQLTKKKLAIEAFSHTASYDIAITKWMESQLQSKYSKWIEAIPLKQKLRYGENPHQTASWFSHPNKGWGGAIQLQGKELSTNNLLDLEAALATVREFGYSDTSSNSAKEKAAVVVKHTNPCGVAIGPSASSALKRALDADRISAFGGIVALNSAVDAITAHEISTLFLECVVAPHYDEKAKEILKGKKNLRLIELNPSLIESINQEHIRSINGGLLIQEQDDKQIDPNSWELVTTKNPSNKELKDLIFAWKIVRHIRSNAISVASNGQSLGIGAGQMNRVGSAKLALEASGSRSNGAVLASDGFFPFDDTVKLANQFGIKAIIQPGGSIKDQDSIEACNKLNISMMFTNKRHFLH